MSMSDLSGRTAIVTGGGRGIGASVARLLGSRGANVIVADLGAALDGSGVDAGPAAAVAADIREAGGKADHQVCDVGDLQSVQELFGNAVESFGEVHIVVNVAGNLRDRMIWNMTEDDWDSVIRVHLKGTFNTVSTAAKRWRAVDDPDGNFRIINFISGAGLWGVASQANYCAAKMGIVGLTFSVAHGLGRYGVTANAVAPIAETRMVDSMPEEHRPFAGPEYSPDNVAPIVAYLAGEQSAWVTGRVFESCGYRLGTYNYMDTLAEISSDGPWDPKDLDSKIAAVLRPAIEADVNPVINRKF
jgi:NAD(P)-dependent dehydrogenase (short-subunit alcohol dehydrogenase family)